MDVLHEEYRVLYDHLQQRFATGDLAPGAGDTYSRHYQGDRWSPDRMQMHGAIMEELRASCAGLPRDGHAVLLTAGPPGAGKGGAREFLTTRQGDSTDLGQALAEAHGVDTSRYVVLDPDEVKKVIVRHGGAPELSSQAMELPGGRQLAPAEYASLIHRESAYLQDQFALWAKRQGYNLLFDSSMKNLPKTQDLLADLARSGYGQRIVLSVEVPMATSLEQNALRWQKGRRTYEKGDDSYGGRMVPESMIHALYPQGTEAASVSRTNAETLHAQGHLTGLIEFDRGNWTAAAPKQHTPVIRHESREAGMRVRIAAAAAATSTTVSQPVPGGPAQPAASTRHQPHQRGHGHRR